MCASKRKWKVLFTPDNWFCTVILWYLLAAYLKGIIHEGGKLFLFLAVTHWSSRVVGEGFRALLFNLV